MLLHKILLFSFLFFVWNNPKIVGATTTYTVTSDFWNPSAASQTGGNAFPSNDLINGMTGENSLSNTIGGGNNAQTATLIGSSFTFGQKSAVDWIPSWSIVKGITAEVSARSTDYSFNLIELRSTNIIAPKTISFKLTAAFQFYQVGGVNDVWERTWSPATINTNSFEIRFGFIKDGGGGSRTLYVQQARVAITYEFTSNIENISPDFVIGLGGSGNITVSGTGFAKTNGQISCKFGTFERVGTLVDSTTIICPIPPSNGYGTVDFSLSLQDQTLYETGFNFEYRCNTEELCSRKGVCSSTGRPCICDFPWKGDDCSVPDCSGFGDCSNGGTCVVDGSQPACNCTADWTGDNCEIPTCQSLNLCNGNGQCIDLNVCNCTSGYQGESCDVAQCDQVRNCNAANEGGICISPNVCECNDGFDGPECLAICEPVCGQNEFCARPNECECNPGFEGPFCNITSTCEGVGNCNGNGVCVANDICSCNTGWLSPDCQNADCSGRSNCNGNGVCVSPNKCECQNGWSGTRCSVPICSSGCNEERGGGTCTEPDICECNSGWLASSNCTLPICSSCDLETEYCSAPSRCSCKSGFLNDGNGNCIAKPKDCSSLSNCNLRGTCVEDGVCECGEDYLPPSCALPSCEKVNNCTDNGECVSPNNCLCDGNYTGADCSRLPEPAQTPPSNIVPNTETSNLPVVLGSVLGVLAFLIVTVIIVILFTRYRRNQKYLFREPPYQSTVFAKSLVLQYDFDGNMAKLEKLRALILNQDFAFAIANITAVTEKDHVAKAFVHFLGSKATIIPFICKMIDKEIANCKSDTTLFRSNSLTIAIFQVFSKIAGIRYLWKTLGGFLAELRAMSDKITANNNNRSSIAGNNSLSLRSGQLSVEIDPSKMEDESAYSVNKYTLLLITQKLFQSVTQPQYLSNEVKTILHHAATSVVSVFPGYKYKVIGSFLFLRFVVPAISAPHIYGLYSDPPDDATQRKLVLMAKVLQNLANEVQFGSKEPHMSNLNDFLVQNTPALHRFFDEVAAPVDPATLSTPEIPPTVESNALLYFHAFLHQNQTKMLAELSNHGEEFTQQFLDAMKEAGTPPVQRRD